MPNWCCGLDLLRLVERADRDRDAVGVDEAERKRRPAVAAETALDQVGALEGRRARRASPRICRAARRSSGAKNEPNAFWHMRQWQMCGLSGCVKQRIAHRAALAPAGHAEIAHGFVLRAFESMSHASIIVALRVDARRRVVLRVTRAPGRPRTPLSLHRRRAQRRRVGSASDASSRRRAEADVRCRLWRSPRLRQPQLTFAVNSETAYATAPRLIIGSRLADDLPSPTIAQHGLIERPSRARSGIAQRP